MDYKKDYVYLISDGCVVGVNRDYLNQKIDYYNSNPFLARQGCFWEWLSWEEDENYYGISTLWMMSAAGIHTIKGVNDNGKNN